MKKQKALLIDGNSLVYRAYFATQKWAINSLVNNYSSTNAIKTSLRMVIKLLSKKQYEYCLIAFDNPTSNWRNKYFDKYKANRKVIIEQEEIEQTNIEPFSLKEEILLQLIELYLFSKLNIATDLYDQLEEIKTLLIHFGINVVSANDLEADDLIASSAHRLNKDQIECEIYSSDKDLLQLVNELNSVYLFVKGVSQMVCYTHENFYKLSEGLKPDQICDYKALVGDKSDNIPGIKGIGKKKAIDLLTEYNDLANIYKNINHIRLNSTKNALLQNRLQADFYKCLVTLTKNYYSNKSLDYFAKKPLNWHEIDKIVKQYHFTKLNLAKLK